MYFSTSSSISWQKSRSYNFWRGLFAITTDIPLMHEIPGQNKVISGSLYTPSKSVKSLDCPGHPWTVDWQLCIDVKGVDKGGLGGLQPPQLF